MNEASFSSLWSAILQKQEIAEEDFLELSRYKQLHDLDFRGLGLSFAEGGFRHLVNLPNLTRLQFERVSISPVDCGYFGLLPRLAHLDFGHCYIGDEHIENLGQPPALEGLNLTGTQITDAALICIGKYLKLKELFLTGTTITDQGLAHLRSLESLQLLWLGHTAISGAGLSHLCTLSSLKLLVLEGTAVTDAGILQLAVLPRLTMEAANVEGANVTKEGLEALFRQQQANRKARGRKRPVVPGLIAEARQQLERFFSALNDFWQNSGEFSRESQKSKSNPERLEKLRVKELNALTQVITEYCVDPSRVTVQHMLRNPVWENHLRRELGEDYEPTPYYHPDRVKFKEVEAKSSSEVAFLIDMWDNIVESDLHYKFIMKKKEGRWLVADKKVWDGRWKREPF